MSSLNCARILAIDTVTEGCSAALLIGDEVREQFEVTPRGHTRRILSMVDGLLSEAGIRPPELDAIAFDRGPGSFTGLRITAGVVQGLAYGGDLPIAPVSSLAALAMARYREHGEQNILSAIDARMGEVYWGIYQIIDGLPVLQGEEAVLPPQSLPVPEGEWVGVGSGWSSYPEEMEQHFSGHLLGADGAALPHAAEIARLAQPLCESGQLLPAADAQPVYLRNQVVHQKGG